MEKVFILMFIFIFACGSVFAAEDGQDLESDDFVDEPASTGGGTFTTDFYIALGIGGLILLTIIIFILRWIGGSRDNWE